MTRMVFVRAGQHKQTLKELSDADARQAEKEGWGQIVDDPKTGATSYSLSSEPDHMAKADAYFNRDQTGYTNRELTSAPSPAVRSFPLAEPDGGADAQQRQTGETAPSSGRTKRTPRKRKATAREG